MDRSGLGFLLVFEGQCQQSIDRFVLVARLDCLCHDRHGTGTGATGGAGDEQKSVRLVEPFRRTDGFNNLVAVLPGYFGTHLVYLADAVAARLAVADKDSVSEV